MAETKKVRRKTTKAQRDRSSVFAYASFDELKACLLSGWSPATTREYLVNRFNDDPGIPSEVAIRKWRDKHCPTAAVIPPEFIRKKLSELDYKVDTLAHLSRMIRLQEDRLSRALDQEEKNFDGLPLPVTDTILREYRETLLAYWKIAQDLGYVKSPPPPIIDMRTQNNYYTLEAMRELKVVAEEIKAIGSPK